MHRLCHSVQVKTVQSICTFLWVLAVVLWPVPVNLRMERAGESQSSSAGEGLYKSEITQASFGLLGFRFYETAGAEPSWNVRSEFAELHREKENYAFLKNMDVDFFSQPGNVIRTKSDYGRCHFDRRLVEMEGNVAMQSAQGYRFTMKKLDFDSANRQFHTNELVHMRGPNIERPDMFLTGVGMDADLNSENFQIRRNTQSRRRLSNSEWINIQSVKSEFRPRANRAIFNQRVRATMPSLTIESDRLEMHTGDARNELLRASGRVVLLHKKLRGKSNFADIEIGNDRIVLEGQASVQSDDNSLKGNRITLYTDEDRVEVEQAEGSM